MQNSEQPWYWISNIAEVDSPALVIFPDRVRSNVRAARQMVSEVSCLRPHVKTHKSPEATRLQIEEGITRFKCATIAEAEMLAKEGAGDVLLAYQPVGPKVLRLRELTRRYPRTRFSCLVDDVDAAHAIASAFAGEPARLQVLVDLNVGMNRTGIRPGEQALGLCRECVSMSGIELIGLHAYDGHIQDRDPVERARRCDEAFLPVRATHDALTLPGAPVIVAGGSPTFPVHARRPGVQCSPGTFIYWDRAYQNDLAEQPFLPAALVISRVVSRPDAGTVCLDLGHKSVAAEKDLRHRVDFLNAPDAEVISQSEEHLVLRVGGSRSFAVGDVLYGLPYHICPTCALYDRAVTVRSHRAEGEWTMTARNRSVGV